jgi:hypothetical protein
MVLWNQLTSIRHTVEKFESPEQAAEAKTAQRNMITHYELKMTPQDGSKKNVRGVFC